MIMKIIYNSDMDCMDSTYATVCNHIANQYEMIFEEGWNYVLLPENPKTPNILGNRLSKGEFNAMYLLNLYYGIEAIKTNVSSLEEFMQIFTKTLNEDKLISFYIDQAFLNWSSESEKTLTRYRGYLLVTSEQNKHFFNCIDIHGTKSEQCVTMEEITKGIESIIENWGNLDVTTFECKNKDVTINYHNVIQSILNRLYTDKNSRLTVFDSIRDTADLVEKSLDFSTEIKNVTNVYEFHLLRNIKQIAKGRNLFLITLNKLSQVFDSDAFNDIVSLYKEATIPWNKLMSLLGAAYFRGNYGNNLKSKIINNLRNAGNLEEEVARKLLDFSDGKTSESISNVKAVKNNRNFQLKSIQHLNIGDYVNTKVFSKDIYNNSNVRITSRGDFLLTDGIPKNKMINIGEMSFKLCGVYNDEDDCISCSNQLIKVPIEYYGSIGLLGFGILGNYRDKLQLIYEDNIVEDTVIEISDCFHPKQGDLTFQLNRLESKGSTTYKKGYLYIENILVDNNRKLLKIRLPDSPEIKIFSISLLI